MNIEINLSRDFLVCMSAKSPSNISPLSTNKSQRAEQREGEGRIFLGCEIFIFLLHRASCQVCNSKTNFQENERENIIMATTLALLVHALHSSIEAKQKIFKIGSHTDERLKLVENVNLG